MNTLLSLKLTGLAMALTVAACGGGGGGGDPISSAVSGGGSSAPATAVVGSTTGTVAAPATGSATTTQTPSPNTTTGYTKATLSGVFGRCPIGGGETKDWWLCMAGLEFSGLTTFGGKACSMRVRTDGAFEYTSDGTTKITPKAVENIGTGLYSHVTNGSGLIHGISASLIIATEALLLAGDSTLSVGVELSQNPGNLSYQVSYRGELCNLNIQ